MAGGVMPAPGRVIGIDRFGESAPAGELFEHFGFSATTSSTQELSEIIYLEIGAANRSGDKMTIKVGINGYGRIGRNILRAIYESGRSVEFDVVAVNDLGDAETNAHLTRRDTAHGPFPGTVEVDGDDMIVNGDRVRVLAERDPAKLPWGELGVDVVFECTGLFRTRETAGKHIDGGAKKVIISAPGGEGIDETIVYGVNHDTLTASDTVISNASCTTNCLAPLVKPLHEKIGVKHGIMTTIHAYTNDQVLTDVYPQGPAPRPFGDDVADPDEAPVRRRRSAWYCRS